VSRLERAKRPAAIAGSAGNASSGRNQTRSAAAQSQSLISQVLDYLNGHFANRDLSLTRIAEAVGKNEKYLAHIFAQQVGERMRACVTALRIRRACELLLATPRSVEQVAREAGFRSTVQFCQLFHRNVGLTATEYRQVFASPTSAAPRRKP
jgi:YesN/AraC family two-component response regulator